MNFTGTEDQFITLAEAAALTKRFRDGQTQSFFIKGGYYAKLGIQTILNQTESVGMRVYFGLDESLSPQMVFVGVDVNGNDLHEGIIVDRGMMCPPTCGVNNPLNSDAPPPIS